MVTCVAHRFTRHRWERLFKVSRPELRALHAGALLHDIGKLAVPEYILNKPGKLTEAEFAKMKIHPTVGGDILKRVNFPYPVEDIVRYHHEKWDGSGYPKGLKGEAIPLVARIISVVDFYDATRCDRPYRKGMKREESLALLRSMAGTAFDPKVVHMFIEHVEEFDRLIDSHDIQEQVASDARSRQSNEHEARCWSGARHSRRHGRNIGFQDRSAKLSEKYLRFMKSRKRSVLHST